MSETPSSPVVPAASTAAGTSTRRSVLRAAAWTTPVIALATAAPAQAASRCVNKTNFNALTTGTKPTQIAFPGTGVTATLSYVGYGGFTGSSTNGAVQNGPQGGNPATQKWIKFENATASYGSGLDVKIVFSEPVNKLSFTLFDLDWADGNHRDAVIATTPPTSFTIAPALQGNGTLGNPWRKITVGEIPSTSLNGNVQLNYTGPITEVNFRYFQDLNVQGSNHNQLIGLSDLAFDKCL
ncbi:hypothetical protein [Pseudoclavibacter terrae]|uniref:Uncharacterized protein n=1 Tax=Pseudoclavibacter terrae TaxID=1530195 RepID=A0A7J5B571_9MICO|nr:hypothetical protein [Pseudoclavibacter terrae]KAB1639214.1 hypothetical protein F8O03_02405 [Pseudoclavibacter terrae]